MCTRSRFLLSVFWVSNAVLLPTVALHAADSSTVQVIAGTTKNTDDKTAYPPNEPNGVATQIALGNTFGVETTEDAIFITTVSDQCVWRMDRASGQLARVAGSGQIGYDGDGGLAVNAKMNWPHEVRIDESGNLYIADTRNHVIRKVDASTGIISTIAGTGEPGFSGDGGAATQATLNQPHSVVLDLDGGALIADIANHRIRRLDLATGIITTFAGNGEKKLPKDGELAKDQPLFGPRSLAVDPASIWIALREGNSVWRIDRKSGTIHHVAGSGKKGYSDEGTPAAKATFNGPKGLAIDKQGNVIVSDTENQAIRVVDLQSNVVRTIIGGNLAPSTTVLKRPHGIFVDIDGSVLVGDSENHRVVRLAPAE